MDLTAESDNAAIVLTLNKILQHRAVKKLKGGNYLVIARCDCDAATLCSGTWRLRQFHENRRILSGNDSVRQ